MTEIIENNDKLTRDFYEVLGPEWLEEKASALHTEAIMEKILIHVRSNDKILDVCCGYGRLTIPLIQKGFDVKGIDISEVLIKRASWLYAQTGSSGNPFFVANMKHFPFSSGAFDFCFCVWASFNFLITEHEQLTFLQEVYRTLKKGGAALIECPLQQEPDDCRNVYVGNVNYLCRPITIDELKNIGSKSSFEHLDVCVESIAGRNRAICLLRKS